MKSYYQVLGLPSAKATGEEIEAAYRRLADEFSANADYLAAVGEAYACLSNPQRRAEYDRRLLRHEVKEHASIQARSTGGGGLKWLGLVSLAVAAFGYYYSTRSQPTVAVVPTTVPASVFEPEARQASAVADDPAHPVQPTESAPDRAVEGITVSQQALTRARHFERPAKKPGFDAEYLSWTTYLVVGGRSRGSGVMVAPDKVLTNCHVVAGNALSGLVVINSATHERTKVDKYSKLEDDEDVCLLSAPGAPSHVAEWGRSESLDIGAVTHTVSFPGNEGLTWSSGKLIRREYPLGMEVLLTSNYCRPGVSGGPLFNDAGHLVGITSAGRMYRGGGSECMSLTAETARKVLYKPMVPIALAPTQYDPAMLRR
jgi:S1-C subfamily serine protease